MRAKLTMILLACLTLAGIAIASGGGGPQQSGTTPTSVTQYGSGIENTVVANQRCQLQLPGDCTKIVPNRRFQKIYKCGLNSNPCVCFWNCAQTAPPVVVQFSWCGFRGPGPGACP